MQTTRETIEPHNRVDTIDERSLERIEEWLAAQPATVAASERWLAHLLLFHFAVAERRWPIRLIEAPSLAPIVSVFPAAAITDLLQSITANAGDAMWQLFSAQLTGPSRDEFLLGERALIQLAKTALDRGHALVCIVANDLALARAIDALEIVATDDPCFEPGALFAKPGGDPMLVLDRVTIDDRDYISAMYDDEADDTDAEAGDDVEMFLFRVVPHPDGTDRAVVSATDEEMARISPVFAARLQDDAITDEQA